MLFLDRASDITARPDWVSCAGPLFFQKTQQARRQGPEPQDRSRRHQLILIAAQQIFLVLKEGFDLPADGQQVDQGLGFEIEPRVPPIAEPLRRGIQAVAGDQYQG
jgi:hypothetical protein